MGIALSAAHLAAGALALATILMTSSACARPDPQEPVQDAADAPADGRNEKAGDLQTFTATAYSIEGTTAAGDHAREGIVAADPDVVPLGTRLRVHDAGEYDGIYVVTDTGRAVRGRELDIYLRSDAEAKRFGKKTVRVEILERGAGRADARQEAQEHEAETGPQR